MTEKKMRKLLKNIWFHYDNLQTALNRAHQENIIKYGAGYDSYQKEAPCSALGIVKDRIELTTEKQIATLIQLEIKRSNWRRR